MPGEIDCPWRDVDVHDPVDDLGLEVALVLVDHILLPGVEQLDEGEVGLVLLRDRLVDLFIMFYPLKEVGDCLDKKREQTVRIKTTNLISFDSLVVWAVHLHLSHVAFHNHVAEERRN